MRSVAVLLTAALLSACATAHGRRVMELSTGCRSGCQAYRGEVPPPSSRRSTACSRRAASRASIPAR